jgi:hypothetical protein
MGETSFLSCQAWVKSTNLRIVVKKEENPKAKVAGKKHRQKLGA